MNALPDINKAEFRRFIQSRYTGARRNSLTGNFYLGAREYGTDELWAEAQCEKADWIAGLAEKPDWIKK